MIFESCRILLRCDPGIYQRLYKVWVDEDPFANIRVRDIIIYGYSDIAYKELYYYGCYDSL